MKYVVSGAILIFLGATAVADEVHLRSGQVVVGIARREPGHVVVETGHGTLTFPSELVASTVPGRTALHDYQDRLAALGPHPKADAVFALARWCQQEGLGRYVNHLLTWTITLDPDHAQARELLDYVKYQGRWIHRHEWQAIERVQSESRERAQERRIRTLPVFRHPLPEMSPGYVYLGIPPGLPPRGTQVHDDLGTYPVVGGSFVRRTPTTRSVMR